MTMVNVRAELMRLSENEYREFSSKLIPEVKNMLGVRLPTLRVLARRIQKEGNPIEFLAETPQYYEEIMVQGMVIGLLKEPFSVVIKEVERFLAKIDNWAICDSFVTGLTVTKKNMDEMWAFLLPLFLHKEPYYVRFATVMAQRFYLAPQYISDVFQQLSKVDTEHYYVMMGTAWAISTFFIYFPRETMPYINENRFDDRTYNTALQKIVDSRRVSDKDKDVIRSMRRK